MMANTASDIARQKIAEAKKAERAEVNGRKLKNFFRKPQYQIKYSNYLIAGGLLSICATASFIQLKLVEVDDLLNSPDAVGFGAQVQIYDALADVAQLAFMGFAGFVVYACILSLIMSYRIAGPMVAILAYIDELKKGNYTYPRELRKSDELKPIHEGLEELGVALRTRE